ncbi:unnamed protein product [Mytilus coruscus]|uniref:Uncharacterized protein n=1 Tax=Mytilus coruscus TaxID=42192 RepID=A0A6J8C643_MYTCO|nr:unnamed protein product [Mytilus coruscus]
MSTLQVKGGSGPAGRTLKTLNNKNNLATLYMRKQLDQLRRENTFSISHLDRDRFETHDFLQQVLRKDSDKHPSSIKYLGKADLKDELKLDNILNSKSISPGQPRRKRRHRRRISPKPPEKSQNTPLNEKFDDISYEKTETPRDKTPSRLERQKTFSIPNYSSQNSTCTTLPSLDRRESVYFQIASGNAADLSSDSSEDETEEPTLEVKTKDLSTRRRSSFVAWVQENSEEQSNKMQERLQQIKLKDNPLEQRRLSFSNFLKRRFKTTRKSVTPAEQLQDISEDTTPDCADVFPPFNNSYPLDPYTDQMKSLMLSKTGRRKPPLNDRISSFFNRISNLKIPVYNFNSPAPKLTALEKRRYTLLTKGIKAALDMSSDEED